MTKFENIKLSLSQTKNPLFFQLGLHLTDEKAKELGLSHGGMAFCLVSKDELKAMMGAGYKPFALATIEGEFREEENQDPMRPKLLKYELCSFTFKGGMGTWEEILNAPAIKKDDKPEAPKGF